MSHTLIVQLPPRPRSGARRAAVAVVPPEPVTLAFALCGEDQRVSSQGQALVTELPPAQRMVVVLAATDVAWHRLAAVPRAPATKLRAALLGLLEEQVLEEVSEVHFALAPRWQPGKPAWVAVTQLGWLQHWLTLLEQGATPVSQVVPAMIPREPDAGCQAHIDQESDPYWLTWADASGVVTLPLESPSACFLINSLGDDDRVRWSASPKAVAAASQVARQPVASVTAVQRWVEAAGSDWNLRQFSLAPRRRTDRWIRAGWQHVGHGPEGRGLRWGVVGLVLANVLGVGVWAWQQNHALKERQHAMNALLQTSFPQVRSIIDAPAQMTRALEALRANAGHPGENDLETLLAVANTVWPEGHEPAQALHFEIGQLKVVSPGWAPAEIQALSVRLAPLGFDAKATPDGWVLLPLKSSSAASAVGQP